MSDTSQRKFSIVLVAYNSADVIGGAIKSVPPGHQVIVVDNASSDQSVQIARDLGADVIALEKNLGFGTGCNRGAAIAKHDTIMFLNPDARLEPGALDVLAAAMDKYPQAGAFSPRIMLETGKQRYVNRNKLINNKRWFKEAPQADCEIPVAHGAVVVFRKSVYEQLGGFDERIFLFFEDVDISARLIKSGGHIWYIHDAVCIHAGASSSGSSSAMTEFRNYHFMLAQSYVSAKHGLIFGLPRRFVSQGLKYVVALFKNDETRKAVARGRLRALLELSKPR